jgi:predicted nucleic acid-binding protein
MIFCDTSFAAKFYVPEVESKAVRKLLEGEDEVCASELMRVELMGVFHRRLREGKWTRADFHAAARQFLDDDIGGFWSWRPLESSIIEAAARTYSLLQKDVFLRSADCLHLTTAVHNDFTEVHTFDRRQAEAAPAFGIKPVSL